MLISKGVNDFIRVNYDQLHIIVPKGTKDYLRRNFEPGMTLNRYINALIELDLRHRTDWSGFDDELRLLREVSATESY